MHEGYVKIYRKIKDNPLWDEKPFSRFQAWLDLILSVNHKERKVMINGNFVEVKPGQKMTSMRKLANEWGWSITKVKKFLDELQNDEMITYYSDTKKTVITIEKWETYQGYSDTKRTQKENKNKTERKQKETNNNVKNVKNDKNNIYVEQVDKIWSAYPNKKGKAIAEKKLPELIEEHGYENIMRCVQRYSSEVTGVDKKYMKHGSTFFTTGYEDYLDSNYQGPDTGKKDEGPVEDVWNPQDYGF